MTNRRTLRMPTVIQAALWNHLLDNDTDSEEAAFVFARRETIGDDDVFNAVEWYAVPAEGFAYRSKFYIELSDDTKAHVIKKAHDLESSLVECHSHLGPWSAQFSPSDFSGFRDFVPHVLWRLRGRPYIALVVTKRGDFDGLVWTSAGQAPLQLDVIQTEKRILRPTGLSLLTMASSNGK